MVFSTNCFFFYGEDTDYCLRLAKRGVPSVIVPASAITHEHHGSFEGKSRLAWVRAYYQMRNYRVVIRRHQGWRTFGQLMWKDVQFCVRAWAGSIWRTHRLGIPEKYCDRFLAVRDVLLNRMGKTIAPEDYLD